MTGQKLTITITKLTALTIIPITDSMSHFQESSPL